MEPVVNQYLHNKQVKIAQLKEAKKREFLIKEGLCYKAYSDKRSAEYPEYDWEKEKYFKYVVYDVSDSEYEELLAAYNAQQQAEAEGKNSFHPEKKNGVAILLQVIAVVTYLAFFILGLVVGDESSAGEMYSYSNDFDVVSMFIYWITGFITGTFTLGFAEIIKLLEIIKNKKN